MIAYLKETGKRLDNEHGHVREWLPKGDHKVILRNTIQNITLENSWDGGETEVTVRSTRTDRSSRQLGYTECPPFHTMGVWNGR
jgi:hypothetical protein